MAVLKATLDRHAHLVKTQQQRPRGIRRRRPAILRNAKFANASVQTDVALQISETNVIWTPSCLMIVVDISSDTTSDMGTDITSTGEDEHEDASGKANSLGCIE